MLGDDLGEVLGDRIPADHSRPVLADHYAGRLRAKRVMDLGCGAGDSVDLFRSVDPEVSWVGVDIERSPEVAERIRADAEFVTFDGRRLPFDDGSFDLVYCKQVLEHVEHPRDLIAEAARVLRPGGHLAGSTSQLEAFHSYSIFNWTPYGFTRVAEDAGLEVVELRPVIDGFTLVAWRGARAPAVLLPLVGARVAAVPGDGAGRSCHEARHAHAQPDQARALRAVRFPGPPAVASGPAWSRPSWHSRSRSRPPARIHLSRSGACT